MLQDTPSMIDIHANQNGEYEIELSLTGVYFVIIILGLWLMINLCCLCYQCHENSKRKQYSKVSQIASSDEDIENFKEYPL